MLSQFEHDSPFHSIKCFLNVWDSLRTPWSRIRNVFWEHWKSLTLTLSPLFRFFFSSLRPSLSCKLALILVLFTSFYFPLGPSPSCKLAFVLVTLLHFSLFVGVLCSLCLLSSCEFDLILAPLSSLILSLMLGSWNEVNYM